MKNTNFKFLDENDLKKYQLNDWVYDFVKVNNKIIDKNIGTNGWLINSLPKRMIFDKMYGDLINEKIKKNLKILDIGGGINVLQPLISKIHHLTLIDILAHDKKNTAFKFCDFNNIKLIQKDWFDFLRNDLDYDLIIANDLFPNVDQRLSTFLDICIKQKCEIRILLTVYENNKFYPVKRVDADELMFMKAWSINDLNSCLSQKFDLSILNEIENKDKSLFPNGRHIAMLKFTN